MMDREILVPLDGSPLAEMVLPQVITLARATQHTVTLLRVTVPPIAAEPLVWTVATPAVSQDTWEAEVQDAQKYLQGVAARLEAAGLTVRTELLEGEPAMAIVDYVEHHPRVSLVAMATHGRSGLRRWVFGSVAERVLQVANVPLLLVRPRSETMPAPSPCRTILVPLDGSVFAEQALGQARSLAAATGATLELLSVVPALVSATGEPEADSTERAEIDRKALHTLYLEHQAEKLQASGLPVQIQVTYGHPAEAILRAAEQAHADLIVMATHGRSGLQQLWLGSVALKVMQGATLPVLLVRAREPVYPTHPAADREPVGSSRGR